MNFTFSIKWNSIRLGGPAHGIITKTVHKTLPGGGGCGCKEWDLGVVGVYGVEVIGWAIYGLGSEGWVGI